MTPEQLDEIEKLAEAATPGPWARTSSIEVADLWAGGGTHPILRAWADRNIDFIAAMREHALPLVKALREAREDAHKHREDALAWVQVSFAHQRERDEARAEVERLKAALEEERALACEEPNPKCSCPGCSYAREKAALKEGDR